MILFEYPLTEQVRTWLRIEASWKRFCHHLANDSVHDHHAAMLAFFELTEIAARVDLKRDLLAILAQPFETASALPTRSCISNTTYSDEELASRLSQQQRRIDHLMREHPFLNILKTRAHVAGGLCSFDLPAFHRWLQKPSAERRRDLCAWAALAEPLLVAVERVLARLRLSGKPFEAKAKEGVFQMALKGQLPRLVQVWVEYEPEVIPKIAANRYQLNLHFLVPFAEKGREVPYLETFSFRLALCP